MLGSLRNAARPAACWLLVVAVVACSRQAEHHEPTSTDPLPADPLAALEACESRRGTEGDLDAELCLTNVLAANGRSGWALRRARTLTEQYPEERAWQRRFQLALRSGSFEEAEMAGSRATAVSAGDARFERHLGIVRLHTRHLEKAVTSLERSVKLDPGSAAGWYALARAYEKVRRDDKALEAYRRCLERAPLDAGALIRRSRLDIRHGRHELARSTLHGLRDGGRLSDQGLYLLARLERRLGGDGAGALLDEYEARSRRSREDRESRIEARGQLERAVQMVAGGNVEVATEALAMATRSAGGESPLTWSIEAAISQLRGQQSRALELSLQALRARPSWWQYQLQTAIYSHLMGLDKDARKQLSSLLETRPLCLEARIYARRLFLSAGDPRGADLHLSAIETLRRYAPEPHPPDTDADLIVHLLRVLLHLDGPRMPAQDGEIPLD